MELPNNILELQKEFEKYGKKIYVGGGAVRDYKLNKKINDYDLYTNTLPKENIEIMIGMGINVNRISRFIISDDSTVIGYGAIKTKEYTLITFGTNLVEPKKKKDVKFTTIDEHFMNGCIDFTINSLLYDIKEKKIIDRLNALKDFDEKIIKSTVNPDYIFIDESRKLRALRFTSNKNWKLSDEIYHTLKKKPTINNCPPKQLKYEFLRAIDFCDDLGKYIKLLIEFNYFNKIFPNLYFKSIFKNNPEEFKNKMIELSYETYLIDDILKKIKNIKHEFT